MIEKKRIDGVLDSIGKTPIIYLKNLSEELSIRLYAKMESQNPGKSLKDRSSKNIILKAIDEGDIDKDTTIIESSSGNMAIGLSRICKLLGLKLIMVVDPNINHHTLNLIRVYGAKVEIVDKKDHSGSYLKARLETVKMLLKSIPNSYTSNQYSNPNNPEAQKEIFSEIVTSLGTYPDYLFVSVSTCGTLKGILDEVNHTNAHTKVIAVDAVGSIIFGGNASTRYLPGMGASKHTEFDIYNNLHAHILIPELDSVAGCKLLLEKECILAGGSTGAQVSALYNLIEKIESNASVCIIVADDGERYLDTIYNEDWVQQKLGLENDMDDLSLVG
ncbi:2,3-diaminopropionate biosynthesis protein SbnA [Sphingobacterium sp. SG20118]|uniref:2,3-diaminopropionate biosynthesis protein SbnA n=1 Tax=Sphingobacterium sp. SG20118 TaxID=3367156 RepID=UPI0037DFC344